MKTLTKRIAACLLALCFALSLMACDFTTTTSSSSKSSDESGEQVEKAYAYIAIDINPSLELVVADGVVESVRAVNDDASVLLSGEELSGLSAEEATEKIVALSEELGYLNDENTDVSITVISDNEDEASELEESAKAGATRGSSRAIVNSNPRLADEREVKALKDENEELYKGFSPAKLRLIKSIMEYDPEMTIELGATMSTKELISLLKEYTEEFKGIVGEELKKRFNERKEEIKLEKQKEIATIFGEEHLEAWEKLEALKELYKELRTKAQSITLSDEDKSAVLAIIGEENAERICDENGNVTVDSVEHFFDRAFDIHRGEGKDELEAILDKYDEDDYALSEDDIAKIAEIAGDAKVAILEDLEELIDSLKKELDGIKNDIKLDGEQRETVEKIEEDFDAIKEQVKEEFRTEIERAKEHFEAKKADRLR
ncbi:MAG: hypothetical protein IJF11_03970 [Clostridia bacterium]|nr:hypothetical protein [Clostridia bacterium]